MLTQRTYFPDGRSLGVFPNQFSDLEECISELGLGEGYPVIVLIGGAIDELQLDATQCALQTISAIANDMEAVVICGGTDLGLMAKMGQIRRSKHYNFPLVCIALEKMVAWPYGLHNTKFLWEGKEFWQLESHYFHFILVPGSQFGDEYLWIDKAVSILARRRQSVTILLNGGDVSRKKIESSLKQWHPAIALEHTG